MKRKVLVIGGIAAATVLIGGWALAQSPGHGPGGSRPGGMMGMHGQIGPGMHGQMGPGMHGQMGPGMQGQMHGGRGLTQFDPARIDTLKTEIGITSAQQPAWAKYTKVIQDTAASIKATHEGVDHDAVRKMSPQDRQTFMTGMREQRQKEFEAVQTAANELLATLNDGQKAKAEKTLPGMGFGPGTIRGADAGGPQHQH